MKLHIHNIECAVHSNTYVHKFWRWSLGGKQCVCVCGMRQKVDWVYLTQIYHFDQNTDSVLFWSSWHTSYPTTVLDIFIHIRKAQKPHFVLILCINGYCCAADACLNYVCVVSACLIEKLNFNWFIVLCSGIDTHITMI